MKIAILGIQGCGKGTQAQKISKYYKIPHISTGEMFRQAMSKNTKMGKVAKSYINCGKLVPDEITTNLVKERISNPDCKNGYILDGYPRNLSQLKDFEKDNKFDHVIYINTDEEIVIKRIKSRRTCEKCGQIYSTLNYSKSICEKCGSKLVIREDEKALDERIANYKTLTFPLVDYFKNQGTLREIDTRLLKSKEQIKEIEEVFDKIKKFLGER